MAYLDATNWLDLQETNATNEKRFWPLGVLDLVNKSTQFVDYISPSAKQKFAEVSDLRKIQIPVMKDQDVVVVQTPGFNFIPANLETTDEYYFSVYDIFSGMRHYPANYANNTIDEAWAAQQKQLNIAHAMGRVVEGILVTNLEARKTQKLEFTTQISAGDGVFTFNTGTDTLEIAKAAIKDTMYDNLNAIMGGNDLPGNYALVTNPVGTQVVKTELAKYGQYNNKDLRALFQIQMERLHESRTIDAGSDLFNGYLVRDGAIGIYENYPYDFRQGTQFAGKTWSISQVPLPYLNLRANIYTNREATDATALVNDANNKMTHFEEMAIWVRIYVVYRYNSDLANRANDIVKVKGLTT